MSLSQVLETGIYQQYIDWANKQPNTTYESVGLGGNSNTLLVKSIDQDSNEVDSISLASFLDVSKWLQKVSTELEDVAPSQKRDDPEEIVTEGTVQKRDDSEEEIVAEGTVQKRDDSDVGATEGSVQKRDGGCGGATCANNLSCVWKRCPQCRKYNNSLRCMQR